MGSLITVSTPEVAPYSYQIYPELIPDGHPVAATAAKPDGASAPDEQFRKIFHQVVIAAN